MIPVSSLLDGAVSVLQIVLVIMLWWRGHKIAAMIERDDPSWLAEMVRFFTFSVAAILVFVVSP